jgi:hypothetical protein
MLTSPQYPNGYYPSCSDLVEVTAQVTTPLPAAALIEPLDPFADENMCGPFVIRWYLDPRPQVERTRYPNPVYDAVNVTYAAELDLQLNVSSMMGNVQGATYTWERRIWRSATRSYETWQSVTFTNPITPNGTTRSGGTYAVTLRPLDSIHFRCTMDFSSVTQQTNPLLDRTCTQIMTQPIYIVMPPEPGTLLAVAGLSNNATTTKAIQSQSSITSSDTTNNAGAQVNTTKTSSAKTHTINLLTAPNPAATQVGLRFTLPADGLVTVEVVNALQQIVLQPLTNDQRQAGEHELTVNVGSLASGTYSVRVSATLPNGVTLVERRTLIVIR